MSYLSRLEEARRQLVSGDFLAAERHYWAARKEWEESRVRAPVLEKGVEPLLRLGGRLFGRDPNKPVLSTFQEREAEILADLGDVASLLQRQTLEKSQLGGEQLAAEDVEVLARALMLRRESRIYELSDGDAWPVLRNYLEGAQRHGRVIDVALLPTSLPLADSARAWLVHWARGRRRRRDDDTRALSSWLVATLEPAIAEGQSLEFDADALSLLCQAKLDDPLGAAEALGLGVRALQSAPPAEDAIRLLRIVTGLATNEDRLAVGAIDPSMLHELGEAAARLGVSWPPPEIAELLQKRRLREASSQVAISWEARERRLLLLRLSREDAVDVLLLEITEPEEQAPFGCGLREARQTVEYYVAPDASVLAPTAAPDWVQGVLGERRVLVLDRLEAALGSAAAGQAPRAPQSPHPAFESEEPLVAGWQPLLQEARWLLPRLLSHAQQPCFAPGWGLANLQALAQAGVGAAALMARAISAAGIAGPNQQPGLQRVPGPLLLQWPWLWERPRSRGEDFAPESVERGQDLLFLHRPATSELAAYAVARAPAQLHVEGGERALQVAACACAAVDPTRVTVMPQDDVCPENALRLLEHWAEDSLSDAARGFDALWLYATLASAPEGELRSWISQPNGGESARSELFEALSQPPARCRLEGDGACFREQLEERRRRSLICVDRLDRIGEDEFLEHLLIDDFLDPLSRLSDADAGELLDRVGRSWRAARSATLWLAAPRLGNAVLVALDSLFGDRVPQLRGSSDGAPELGLHAVSDGYRPACGLLAAESEALLRGRLRRWADRRGPKGLWPLPDDESLPALDGVELLRGAVAQAQTATVLLPRLATGTLQPGLALLRIAAAVSWAKAELAILDPRIAELRPILERASGLRDWTPERAMVADGASVLAELPARENPHWRQPLHAERLRELATWLDCEDAAGRAVELANCLQLQGDQGRALVGGLRDAERLLTAACIARLARESLDGGPLGIRTVIWLSESEGEGRRLATSLGLRHAALGAARDTALEEVLLELEAGRVQWLQLHPAALRLEELRRFGRRAPGLLWLLPNAERWIQGHPAESRICASGAEGLGELIRHGNARCLAFVDDPRSDAATRRLEATLGLRWRALEAQDYEASWRLLRRRLPDPAIACPHCQQESSLAHARQPCAVCGLARLDGPEARVSARLALLDRIVDSLGQAGPQEEWLLLAPDRSEADELRRRLGIDARADELFAAPSGGDGYAQRLCTLAELYDRTPAPMRVVLPALPTRAQELRALCCRLAAAGWGEFQIEMLDHPVAWDMQRSDDPEWGNWGPGASLRELRWRAGRSEVEFRFRQALRAPTAPRNPFSLEERGLGPARGDVPAGADLPALLDELVDRGLHFEEDAALLAELGLDRFATAQRQLLRWLVEEGLLDARPRVASASPLSEASGAFAEAMLALPYDEPTPPPATEEDPREQIDDADELTAFEGGWLLGVAGSGRSRRLLNFARGIDSPRRRLLLVPNGAAVLGIGERCASLRPRLELATAAEIELAFLRHHHQSDGYAQALRLLPAAISEEGRRLRAELLRDLSRRYAAVAGSVPAVDIEDLQLLLEGRAPRIAAAVAGGSSAGPVDLGLLEQCATEARREAGWITPTELRRWSREALDEHPYIAEAWRRRYAALLVDDAHAFAPDELAFVERLFPEGVRAFAADPNLLDARWGVSGRDVETGSRRWPKELARAAASLLSRESGRRATPRGLRRGKGQLERQRVLNLGACALRIESDAREGLLAESRNAIFVSHRGDLDPLSARLRESGLEIWPAEEMARVGAEGPRQLLAALQLIHGLSGDMPAEQMADLAVVLLRAEGLAMPSVDRHALARRLVSWRHGVGTEATRPAEALLLVLLDLGRQLASVWSLAEAAQKVADAGLLARLLRSDAVAERLRRFLEQEGERPWRLLPSQLRAAALADPLAAGPQLWILRPEEANGLEFDRVYSICSGLEPHEHHYRALARTRKAMIVLYAERDPFGEQS